MKLYDFPPSGNGYKVRLLLAYLGHKYEYVPLDILQGETRRPSFLAKNSNGKIPVLELDDGAFVAESNAILYYLSQGTSYWPDEALAQAQVLQWLFFEQYSHEPNIATPRFWLAIQKAEMTPRRRVHLAERYEKGRNALSVMERHSAEHPFFVGPRCSIADISLYAYTHVAEEGGFELESYPAVRAWLDRMSQQSRHITIENREGMTPAAN